jgi:hypothetical protein
LVAEFAHQLWAASLIELQEMGVYEVIGTEPDLTAFEPERPIRSAAPSRPQASRPETPGQRHERKLAERLFRLEELGEPYSVCVICEVPLADGDRCSCGTKLQPKIVRPPSPTPDNQP